jgi:hypothetical protein
LHAGINLLKFWYLTNYKRCLGISPLACTANGIKILSIDDKPRMSGQQV